jgi:hypothetical protein
MSRRFIVRPFTRVTTALDVGRSYRNRRGSPLKRMSSMRTAIIPAKNISDDVEDSSTWEPESRRAIQPNRNAQPCHAVGGPQPRPDGFDGNQYSTSAPAPERYLPKGERNVGPNIKRRMTASPNNTGIGIKAMCLRLRPPVLDVLCSNVRVAVLDQVPSAHADHE